MRIAVLFARLGPYHHARLKATGELCDLVAIELSAIDKTYAWEMVAGSDGFKRLTLFKNTDLDETSTIELRNVLWKALDTYAPEVVAIPGWATTSALLALAWCRHHNIPAILMSDSQEIDEPRVWWKEWVKSRIVRQYSVGFVAGSRHKDYLEMLGMPREMISTGYDVVDNNHFCDGAAQCSKHALKHRIEKTVPERFFLNSSRFVDKKNLTRLIDAFALYSAAAGEAAWSLVILGDGPLRPQLEEQIARLDLGSLVFLPGFKQYNELPVYYGLASVYVQSSTTEQWGLVVNEAMAAGLPILVSDRCGCAPDLVSDGVNGYVFDPFDIDGLAELMGKIAMAPERLETMGEESRRLIDRWTPEFFAEGLLKASNMALDRPVKKSKVSKFDRLLLKVLC